VRRLSTIAPVELAPLPFAASLASAIASVALLAMLARRRPRLKKARIVGLVLVSALVVGVVYLDAVGRHEPASETSPGSVVVVHSWTGG
jgi:hypothetical protein